MAKLECDCGRKKHTSLGCGVPMLDPKHPEPPPDQYLAGLNRALELVEAWSWTARGDDELLDAIRAEIEKREGK